MANLDFGHKRDLSAARRRNARGGDARDAARGAAGLKGSARFEQGREVFLQLGFSLLCHVVLEGRG